MMNEKMAKLEPQLLTQLQQQCGSLLQLCQSVNDEVTVEVAAEQLLELCRILRDHKAFQFDTLIDLCVVDYAEYGIVEWITEEATSSGFSRGVEQGDALPRVTEWKKPRFAVVYHLLSTVLNQRLRLRSFCHAEPPIIESVIDIWRCADWFEREAFDLFGVLFQGHPDLRRILTDYGFIGHPFRKDFPLSGNVEMRYDAKLERVIYEPVDIEPRVLVPKVGRVDNRYRSSEASDD